MQPIETAHGWLILDGSRWLGPGTGWQESPRPCRYSFNSRLAAEATIATLQAETEKGTDDLKTGTATKAATKTKRVRAVADSGKAASGELDYPPAA